MHMMKKVPEPLAAYFAATNAHDLDAMLAPFAPTAIVKDDGQEMRGTPAIREWIRQTKEKYRHTVAVLAVKEKDGSTIVTGRVAGNFPGSPVNLRYDVTVDAGKISRLMIRP
jgi:ketosteroid isomerase-like protein